MAAVGGSIQQATIDGRRFPVAADADMDRDLGGFMNEASPNGDGSVRYLKTRKPWKFGGLNLSIDENRGDQAFLQEKANALEPYPITVTFVSGHTYEGVGMITGDIAVKSASATGQIELSGEGEARQQ